jgi:hypothetical protein
MSDGASGVFYTSVDGLNTTYQSSIPVSYVQNFTRIGGNWVAFNDSGAYAYSSNGTTWTTGTLPSWNSNFMIINACNNGAGGTLVLTVMRFDGTPTNVAYSTTNGSTWTARTMPSTGDDWQTSKWSHGGGRFGAAKTTAGFNASRAIAFSTNGTSWSTGTAPPSDAGGAPVFGAGAWFMINNDYSELYYTNTNLSGTWTSRSLPSGTDRYNMFSAGAFVYTFNSSTGELYRTSDLINWSLYGQMDILNYITPSQMRFALVADLAPSNMDTIIFDATVGANATIVQDLGLVVPHGKKVTVQANSANGTFIGNGSERDI